MRIFIRTFGCTLNQSDSEVMSGLLVKAGHELVADVGSAQLVLFNTCTVKDNPEKRFFSELKKALSLKKKVVVAGCIPQAEPENKLLKQVSLSGVSLVGVRNINRIVEAVEATFAGNTVNFLDFSNNPRLNLPRVRKNPVVEIIPLLSGCLGECTYCKTRLARGKLLSYEPKTIKQQFENAVKEGVKEIWLTSQDNGAYGKDINFSLPKLLCELVKIEGDYKIRLGMLNPNHALEFADELVDVMNHPRMFKFLHLPLQSGSNHILKLMNRKYSADDFALLVEKFRKGVPGITIATDIIAGFPSETDEEFQETYNLLEKLRIPVVNITKFCPRPGTPAKTFKVLPNKVSKNRTLALAQLQEKLNVNNGWLGWSGNIIIDELGKNNSFVGRNEFYKPVVLKKTGDMKNLSNVSLKIGDVVKVKVNRVTQHYLESILV